VRSKRNPLDVLISREKHHKFDVSHHCTEKQCQQQHLNKRMELSADKLLHMLEEMTAQDAELDDVLERLNVPHIQVSFEKLYHADSAEEWMRIFHFLGVGPAQDLTIDKVQAAMEHLPTSNPKHEDTLMNYDEIVSVLKGTEFEEFLHRR
jgi:hypothetical protein